MYKSTEPRQSVRFPQQSEVSTQVQTGSRQLPRRRIGSIEPRQSLEWIAPSTVLWFTAKKGAIRPSALCPALLPSSICPIYGSGLGITSHQMWLRAITCTVFRLRQLTGLRPVRDSILNSFVLPYAIMLMQIPNDWGVQGLATTL